MISKAKSPLIVVAIAIVLLSIAFFFTSNKNEPSKDDIPNTKKPATSSSSKRPSSSRPTSNQPSDQFKITSSSPTNKNAWLIGGKISDESGAAVQQATVYAIARKGASLSDCPHQTTDAKGIYQFESLPGGIYELRTEAPGFMPQSRQEIVVTDKMQPRQVDFALSRGMVLEGHITQETGNGTQNIPGAEIKASGTIFDSQGKVSLAADAFLQTTQSDANGQFKFHSPDEFLLTNCQATLQDHIFNARMSLRFLKGDKTPPIAISLPPNAEIHGIVINSNNQPISGAKVTIKKASYASGNLSISGIPQQSSTCDAEGRFVFPKLFAEVDYVFEAQAANYPPSISTEIKAGATPDEAKIIMHPGYRIVGKVLEGGTGAPLADFLVLAQQTDGVGDALPLSAKTDNSGQYGMHIQKGNYLFHGKQEANDKIRFIEPTTISLDSEHQAIETNLTAWPAASIKGKVLYKENKQPVPNIRVTASIENYASEEHDTGCMAKATSDAQGSFTIPNLASGIFNLQAHSDAGIDLGVSEKAEIKQGVSLNEVTLYVTQDGVITGIVLDAKNQPVPGVSLIPVNADSLTSSSAWNYDVRTQQKETLSQTDGTFRMSGIPIGGPGICLIVAPHSGPYKGVSEKIELTPEHPTAAVVFHVEKGNSISGTTKDQSGAPIPNVDISLRLSEATSEWNPVLNLFKSQTRSNADGQFVINGLSPGTYLIQAAKDGYVHKSLAVGLPEGQSKNDVEIVLDKGAEIFGVLLDINGKPLAGWKVQAVIMVNSKFFTPSSETDRVTSADGTFRLSDLQNKPYRVIFRASLTNPPIQMAFQSTPIEPSKEQRAFVLPLGGTLKGRLPQSEDPAMVKNLRLTFQFNASAPTTTRVGQSQLGLMEYSGQPKVADDGSFSITPVPMGSFTLGIEYQGKNKSMPDFLIGADSVTDIGEVQFQ